MTIISRTRGVPDPLSAPVAPVRSGSTTVRQARALDLERRLVARAQRDAAALEDVCVRARPMLQRHARRLLGGSSADVEDAVQEALILACARIGTYGRVTSRTRASRHGRGSGPSARARAADARRVTPPTVVMAGCARAFDVPESLTCEEGQGI
jgi:hypothetical protein